jgi:phosphoglucosamine mutase
MRVRYFGTDGIRGPYGDSHVNPGFFQMLGGTCREFLRTERPSDTLAIAVGRDPRPSGIDLQNAFIRGFSAPNTRVYDLGVAPTPAIAAAVIRLGTDLGIAITASHNPFSDNGIKFFDDLGTKLDVSSERSFEALLDDTSGNDFPVSVSEAGPVESDDAVRHYVEATMGILPARCLSGWTVVVDTANGAMVRTTPSVLRALGADVVHLGQYTDGESINEGCGSEHPEILATTVCACGARLGIAHDGDGDRAVFVDERGAILTGDESLAILGHSAIRSGSLAKSTLVATILSNHGLDRSIAAAGGRVERVDVGDRNVVRRMVKAGFTVGGESSGHFVLRDYAPTGDGLVAALKIIGAMLDTGDPLSKLRQCVHLYPQATRDLNVKEKIPLDSLPGLQSEIAEIENSFAAGGRILVRYSGTEPKIRLLVEAEDPHAVAAAMQALAKAIRSHLPFAG